VYTSTENGGNYQKWNLIKTNNGYLIRNYATNLYLDSNSDGQVFTSPLNTLSDSQIWNFFLDTIINFATGKALDSNSVGNAYTLEINNGDNQNWSWI
jgi:hypothetical protein